MNVENLKSELQQVLDNDVVLRKEFNELKRSLSDYRNQLIMRDEDCKRLQVTIDVLNTKLVVMERDNTNYKSELASFQELRSTIREQLDHKQQEIDARLEEIATLKSELNSIAENYENRIAALKSESEQELERVTAGFSEQINELRTNTHYKESGIRDDYENRLSELTNRWADQEQSLRLNHEEELSRVEQAHADTVAALVSSHQAMLASVEDRNTTAAETQRTEHAARLQEMEERHRQQLESLEVGYSKEIGALKQALEEQRQTLTANFNQSSELLRAELAERESSLVARYEAQIDGLKMQSSGNLQELSLSFQDQLTTLAEQHAAALAAMQSNYEEQLSNTLIHSNGQNSRLSAELEQAQAENTSLVQKIQELVIHTDAQTTALESSHLAIASLNAQVQLETERLAALQSEFDVFRQNASLTSSEQINELNTHIGNLTASHAEVVTRLHAQIEDLYAEVRNMGQVFENTTNQLSETENTLEQKEQEILAAHAQLAALRDELNSVQEQLQQKDAQAAAERADLESNWRQALDAREVDYQKLLVENTSLIDEINQVQDQLENREAEMTLLRGELEEVRQHSVGKAEHFKETLANKNFQITNLEAAQAGLQEELHQVKQELLLTRQQAEIAAGAGSELEELRLCIENLTAERNGLFTDLQNLQTNMQQLNSTVAAYETEINALRQAAKSDEQDAFIDRLFKQIDQLNDERLVLLNEKEQMAGQLLKMNETVGLLSQHVESENIDVQSLNNHRKNVILANNLGGMNEKSHLKGQINDLVREIDKCIALLSA